MIDKKNVQFKYIINYPEDRTVLNLLYEICEILLDEGRTDNIFNIADVNTKTTTRISNNIKEDLTELEKAGYIKKLKYTQYEVLKTPWQ